MFNELAVYDHHDEVSAEQALAAFAVAILVVRSISIPALLVSGPLFTCSELAIELNKLLYSDLEDESLHVDKDVLAHGMIMFQKVLGNDPGIGVFKWTLGRRYGAEYRPVDIANMSFSQYGLLANLAEQPFGYCFDLTNNSQIPTLLRAISVVKDTLISEFYKKKTKKLQSHSSDQSAVWFQQTTTVTREEIIWSMRKPSFIIKALAPLPLSQRTRNLYIKSWSLKLAIRANLQHIEIGLSWNHLIARIITGTSPPPLSIIVFNGCGRVCPLDHIRMHVIQNLTTEPVFLLLYFIPLYGEGLGLARPKLLGWAAKIRGDMLAAVSFPVEAVQEEVKMKKKRRFPSKKTSPTDPVFLANYNDLVLSSPGFSDLHEEVQEEADRAKRLHSSSLANEKYESFLIVDCAYAGVHTAALKRFLKFVKEKDLKKKSSKFIDFAQQIIDDESGIGEREQDGDDEGDKIIRFDEDGHTIENDDGFGAADKGDEENTDAFGSSLDDNSRSAVGQENRPLNFSDLWGPEQTASDVLLCHSYIAAGMREINKNFTTKQKAGYLMRYSRTQLIMKQAHAAYQLAMSHDLRTEIATKNCWSVNMMIDLFENGIGALAIEPFKQIILFGKAQDAVRQLPQFARLLACFGRDKVVRSLFTLMNSFDIMINERQDVFDFFLRNSTKSNDLYIELSNANTQTCIPTKTTTTVEMVADASVYAKVKAEFLDEEQFNLNQRVGSSKSGESVKEELRCTKGIHWETTKFMAKWLVKFINRLFEADKAIILNGYLLQNVKVEKQEHRFLTVFYDGLDTIKSLLLHGQSRILPKFDHINQCLPAGIASKYIDYLSADRVKWNKKNQLRGDLDFEHEMAVLFNFTKDVLLAFDLNEKLGIATSDTKEVFIRKILSVRTAIDVAMFVKANKIGSSQDAIDFAIRLKQQRFIASKEKGEKRREAQRDEENLQMEDIVNSLSMDEA